MKPFAQLVLRCYVIVVTIFTLAPVLALVVYSLQVNRVPSLPIHGITLTWYRKALSDSKLREGILNSFQVGSAVGILSTILGFTSARFLARRESKWKLPYVILVAVPSLIPALLSGIAFLIFFQRVHLAGTLWAVVIAHVTYTSPFAMAFIHRSYVKLNVEIEQAAVNLGAGKLRVIFQIVLPQLWPALVASVILCFLLSWDEFVVAWFVCGFERTLPVVIYGMMAGALDPSLDAAGVMAIGVSLALLVSVYIFSSVLGRGNQR